MGSGAAQQLSLIDVHYYHMKIVAEQESLKLTKHNKETPPELDVADMSPYPVLTSPESSQNGLTMEYITNDYKDVFEGLGQLGPNSIWN